MSNPLLIIFVKNPEKGKVKTRLAADVGEDRALEIYKQLLDHTHSITVDLDVVKKVYYSQRIDNGDLWDIGQYEKFVQSGDGLGEKMASAFTDGFKEDHGSICIIGSDCFEITEQIINEAFEQLTSNDVVVGPANDGGYYLLGMNTYHPQLFEGKTYSTSSVLRELLDEIESLNLTVFKLPTLNDVDTVADLNY